MAAAEPNAAIMAAFSEVERTIRTMLVDMGYGQTDTTPLRARVGSLQAEGVITAQTAEAIRGLQMLRNLVTHRPEEAERPGRALDYLAMADRDLVCTPLELGDGEGSSSAGVGQAGREGEAQAAVDRAPEGRDLSI